MWQLQLQQNPQIAEQRFATDQQIYRNINRQQAALGPAATYTIPVVVHLIHNGGPENIPDATVQQGIADLNAAFANTGAFDPNTGVNVDIDFCLAQQDPSGNGTTGIVRVLSPLTNMVMETQDQSLKNLSRWNPNDYLNIWLVGEISSSSMGSGVAGYAYFPSSHGANNDGIVNEARWFGSSTSNSKIHVHEAGHYLGLYHTFQGGCGNNDCQQDGDRVCDTPPDNSNSAVACTASPNTCSSDADDTSTNNPFRPVSMGGLGDQPDMFINYMDYGYQACQTAFTQGQKDRMVATISGPRSSLLNSLGCLSPCSNTISAGFTPSGTTVNAGDLVTFSNTTTGATIYDWQINGSSFSTSANPFHTFNAGGIFDVTLVASNTDPSCVKEVTVQITVICSEAASFSASATSVNIGDQVTFTNTSTGGSTSFEWLVDGTSESTSTHFTRTFPAAGGYHIALVQHGAACSDTSIATYVTVGLCNPKEGNNWYFGYGAGLDFNSGTPQPLTNAHGQFNAGEACATISDSLGNLLFYTQGNTIYNQQHQQMVNGDSLESGFSATMGALIIPKPNTPNHYYMFNVQEFGYGGMHWSEIDMTLDGGNGEVTSKNNQLLPLVTEKLTAVNHCNGTDVWVVVHEWGNDAFQAFQVTPSGILPPVTSNVGVVHSSANVGTVIGQMKISPRADKLALTIAFYDEQVELFDFDNSTGVVSNGFNITDPNFDDVYGVEFSPDGSKLYLANAGAYTNPPDADVWQLDVDAGTNAQIYASAQKISGPDGNNYGGMQIGPDGKIYMGRYEGTWNNYWLGVISNPNAAGTACNFDKDGLYMGGQIAGSIGLPNNNQSLFFSPTPEIAGPDTVCAYSQGIVYHLPENACSGGGVISFQASGNATIISSTDSSATLSFGASGQVNLTVLETASCGEASSQMTIYVQPSDSTVYLGPDIDLCTGAQVTLDAGAGYSSYLWSNGSSTQDISVSTPGTYWVEVGGGSTCRPRDSIVVTNSGIALSVNLGPDQTVCSGQVATMDAGAGYNSYLWQDGTPTQQYTAWFPGTYSVTVTSAQCSGTASDMATIIHSQPLSVNIGPDTVLCGPQTHTFDAGPGHQNIVWQDGSSGQTFTGNTPGWYWVEVSDNNGCSARDSARLDACLAGEAGWDGLQLQFWPNPTGGDMHFAVDALRPLHAAKIAVYDLRGKRLLERNLPKGSRIAGQLDLTGLAAGMYMLQLEYRYAGEPTARVQHHKVRVE